MGECSKWPGREGESVPDRDRALAAHEGLVRWVVRRQGRGRLTWAEAAAAGREGLWRALDGYQPERGARFSSYAVPAIARAVWRAVAAAEPVGTVALAAAADLLWEPDWAAEVDRATVATALREAVSSLPERWRRVVVWHWGLDGAAPQTFATIGQRLGGLSRQRVHQLHEEALRALAHPERSRALRRLLGRHQRADYQQVLARARRAARQRRAGHRQRRVS
jgi:RNA polymerase sigma factor (sigma-70 family)